MTIQTDALDVCILYKSEDALSLEVAIKLVCGFPFSDMLSKSGQYLGSKILDMVDCSDLRGVEECFSRDEIIGILMDISDGK